MTELFWRIVYNFIFTCFAIGYLPIFLARGKHRAGFWERLGRLPQEKTGKLGDPPVIWVHAASVGESLLAVRLIDGLREKLPGYRYAMTTVTRTGQEVAAQRLKVEDLLLYAPFDWQGIVRRFFEAIRPSILVIMETEIWPNLILEADQRSIPVVLVNGRISDKAFARYEKVRFLTQPVLSRLKWLGAQSGEAKDRLIHLGALPARVAMTGNMKYDVSASLVSSPALNQWTSCLNGSPLWIASSTHPGEEEAILGVYKSLLHQFPALKLLIAPRHPERVGAIEKEVIQQQFKPIRVGAYEGQGNDKDAVYLLDLMGVLKELYRFGDVIFMGGSLVSHGGHNLAEPALFEKAIVYGPHMENFREMADLFDKHQAGFRVSNSNELKERLSALLEDPGLRESVGKKAKNLAASQSGAILRNIDGVIQCLTNSKKQL